MCMFVHLFRSERHQHLISAFDGTWRSHMVGRQATGFQVRAVIAWSTNTKPNMDHRFSSANCYRFEILRQFRDVSRPFSNNNSTIVEFGPPPYNQVEAQRQHRLWMDKFHDNLMNIPRRTRDVGTQTDEAPTSTPKPKSTTRRRKTTVSSRSKNGHGPQHTTPTTTPTHLNNQTTTMTQDT